MRSSSRSSASPRSSTLSRSSSARTESASWLEQAGSDLPGHRSGPHAARNTSCAEPIERSLMATVYREGNLDLLSGKVAVLGYGSQGHAHALNLSESGVDVEVGLREGSSSRAAAEEAGLAVRSVADAGRGAQLVAILVPDGAQPAVFRG